MSIIKRYSIFLYLSSQVQLTASGSPYAHNPRSPFRKLIFYQNVDLQYTSSAFSFAQFVSYVFSQRAFLLYFAIHSSCFSVGSLLGSRISSYPSVSSFLRIRKISLANVSRETFPTNRQQTVLFSTKTTYCGLSISSLRLLVVYITFVISCCMWTTCGIHINSRKITQKLDRGVGVGYIYFFLTFLFCFRR